MISDLLQEKLREAIKTVVNTAWTPQRWDIQEPYKGVTGESDNRRITKMVLEEEGGAPEVLQQGLFFCKWAENLKSFIKCKNVMAISNPLSICHERKPGTHPPDLTACTEAALILSVFFQMSEYLTDFNN